jgi:hypothetical protein
MSVAVHATLYAVVHDAVPAVVAHPSHSSELPGAQLPRHSALSRVQLLGSSAGLPALLLLPANLSPLVRSLVCVFVSADPLQCLATVLLGSGPRLLGSSAALVLGHSCPRPLRSFTSGVRPHRPLASSTSGALRSLVAQPLWRSGAQWTSPADPFIFLVGPFIFLVDPFTSLADPFTSLAETFTSLTWLHFFISIDSLPDVCCTQVSISAAPGAKTLDVPWRSAAPAGDTEQSASPALNRSRTEFLLRLAAPALGCSDA